MPNPTFRRWTADDIAKLKNMHKAAELSQPRVWASEWSAQTRPHTTAVANKRNAAFRKFIAERS
jgi:hypothetical protein